MVFKVTKLDARMCVPAFVCFYVCVCAFVCVCVCNHFYKFSLILKLCFVVIMKVQDSNVVMATMEC